MKSLEFQKPPQFDSILLKQRPGDSEQTGQKGQENFNEGRYSLSFPTELSKFIETCPTRSLLPVRVCGASRRWLHTYMTPFYEFHTTLNFHQSLISV